jgi:circadian clock protein KaiC
MTERSSRVEAPPGADASAAPVRVSTGVRGLDEILGGGLWKGGIYIVGGVPGSGKTTFGNQVSFNHVSRGGRAVYVTLLAETHARMLFQMRSMTFFDESAIGDSLVYLNGFTTVEKDGLEGLLTLSRQMVRDRKADLLVIDGMLTADALAKSQVDYKKFINELQTWVGFVGCTVIFLTSAGPELAVRPEHTMVDGILELTGHRVGLRADRHLTVTKFRGSAFLEGSHLYRITSDGVVVHPRLEGMPVRESVRRMSDERLATGVPGFDQLLGGGLARGSTMLVLGSPGAGKTTSGLQYLAAGATAGKRGLYFGFSESPAALLAKSAHLELGLNAGVAPGAVELVVHAPTECLLDELAEDLLRRVRAGRVERLVVDGLGGFEAALGLPERRSAFLTALAAELGGLGVTSIFTDQTPELIAGPTTIVAAPPAGVFENIVLLRQEAHGDDLRRTLRVVKTRDSAHDLGAHEVAIGAGGIRIGAAIAGASPGGSGSLRGSARREKKRAGKRVAEQRGTRRKR